MMTRGRLTILTLSCHVHGSAGQVRIQPSAHQEYCLDLTGGDATQGTSVWMWECNGHPSQSWIVEESASNIKFAGDTSLCVDVIDGNIAAGTNLEVWECNGLSQQQFAYDSESQALSLQEPFCMDLPGNQAYNGALMWIWDCNGEDSQQFTLEGDAPSPSPSPPPPAPPSPSGAVTIKPASDESYCLDLAGGDTSKGTSVWMWECNGHPSQSWIVEESASNIKFAGDPSVCVDVTDGNIAAGTQLQLWECNGFSQQQFAYDSESQALSLQEPFCVDLPGNQAYNGALMWIWDCNGEDSQQFTLEGDAPFPSPSPPPPAPPSPSPSGPVTIMPVSHGDNCLDLPGGDSSQGSQIWMWECNGQQSQSWIVDEASSTIQFAGDSSMCVDVTDGNIAAGTHLQLWQCNGMPQQHIEYFSYTQTFWWPTASENEFCMDLPGNDASKGNLMWIWDCNGQESQRFTMSQAPSPSPTPTPTPGPPTPPCPAPSPSPPSDNCPGGSLFACVTSCPGAAGSSERKLCVTACEEHCPNALSISSSYGSLETYPAPSSSFPSGPFVVSVVQDGNDAQNSFVYHSAAQDDAPDAQQGRTASWTTFAFAGVVTVKVVPSSYWQTAVIRPLSLGISVCRDGDAAVFTLTEPEHVVVEFDGETQNSLLIFGDGPEAEEDKIADVIYGPGEYDIGVYSVEAGTSIRLEGGAWVRGQFVTQDSDNIKIVGRGVLSGENIPHDAGGGNADDSKAMLNLCGDDITIKGITIVNPPTYLVNINPYWLGCAGVRTLVQGVKAMGWYFTTDGIMVGRDSTVRGNFVRANDDSLKLYMSNTVWERNTIWQEDNGQSFMISWNTDTAESNITVRDCTVVHVEHQGDYGDNPPARPAVFGAVHGGEGDLSGFSFENIIVEGPVFRPFAFSQAKNPWGGSGTGTISGVSLQGVSFTGAAQSGSVINGHVSQVAFKGLTYEGQLVSSVAEGNFDVSLGASDITFSSAQKASSVSSSEVFLI